MPVLSTGLANYLAGYGSLRWAFQDCVMKIYTGTMPTTADEAHTGTLLCTLTSASVTTTLRNAYGQIVDVLIGSHGSTETWYFTVQIDTETVLTTRTYTNTPDLDLAPLAARLCKLFQDVGVQAVATGSDGHIYVMAPSCCNLTIDHGGTGTVTSHASALAADANDEIRFGPPTAGVISKHTVVDPVWSGVNAATGVAGYFRIVTPDDTDGAVATEFRYQGTIATSGSDLNMTNTTLTSGATTTIDSYSLTEPKSA